MVRALLPVLLIAHTAHASPSQLPFVYEPSGPILHSAIVTASTAVGTRGDSATELRIGLGDAADWGIATYDAGFDGVPPYVVASFRMGVFEHRLFRGQPAVALAFRKSFAHEHAGILSRTAQLSLTATRTFADRITVHAGAGMWDSLVVEQPGHVIDRAVARTIDPMGTGRLQQIVTYGGIEGRPLEHSTVFLDGGVAHTTGASFPSFAYGVRYYGWRGATLESSVRVAGDVQIFGAIQIRTDRLRSLVQLRSQHWSASPAYY